MAPDGTNSGGRRRRFLAAGALGGVLLLALAIALGVAYSGKGHHGAGVATQGNQGGSNAALPASADGGNVAKVLDALNQMNAGGDDATTTTTTTPVAATTDGSKDGILSDATNTAGGAAAPGPVGVIQTLSANAAKVMGMTVCTPKDGPELVRESVGPFVCICVCVRCWLARWEVAWTDRPA